MPIRACPGQFGNGSLPMFDADSGGCDSEAVFDAPDARCVRVRTVGGWTRTRNCRADGKTASVAQVAGALPVAARPAERRWRFGRSRPWLTDGGDPHLGMPRSASGRLAMCIPILPSAAGSRSQPAVPGGKAKRRAGPVSRSGLGRRCRTTGPAPPRSGAERPSGTDSGRAGRTHGDDTIGRGSASRLESDRVHPSTRTLERIPERPGPFSHLREGSAVSGMRVSSGILNPAELRSTAMNRQR